MHIDITALRAMTYEIAARGDAGEDVRTEAAMVKLCAGEWGARCLDSAIQVHGRWASRWNAADAVLPLSAARADRRRHERIQRVLIARKLFKS